MDMPTTKPEGASRSIDPDEAPPLDREWFERAEIREGKRLVRPANAAVHSDTILPALLPDATPTLPEFAPA